jgi:hypothetical protein
MSSRFYYSPGLSADRIARDFMGVLQGQGYQVQSFGGQDNVAVQLRKGGDFEAILGLQAAITITLQKSPEGVMAVAGQQKWIDKAAIGFVGWFFPPFWPLMITAGVGAVRQAALSNEILEVLDTVVMRQQAGVRVGPPPPNMQPPQQPGFQGFPGFRGGIPGFPPRGPQPPQAGQWQGSVHTMPAIICPHCRAANEPGDRFCSHCGKSLQVQTRQCPRCQAPLRPNTAFCTKCGSPVTAEQPAANAAESEFVEQSPTPEGKQPQE